ncbi:MAG: hypothetical protein ACKV1O_30950 [Saprospiraceae bacterium]
MADLTVKYLQGGLFLKNKTISASGWHAMWLEKLKTANENKSWLVVFAIPNSPNGDFNHSLVEEIERVLQANFSPSQDDEPLEISLT